MRIHAVALPFMIALLSLWAVVASAATPANMNLVHRDAEFVAHVDVRKLFDSVPAQVLLAERMDTRGEALLRLIESTSGVNVMEDIDAVLVFGNEGDDDSMGVAVKARFDQQKLSTLLALAAEHSVLEVRGVEVHTWFDAGENRQKYGVFLPDAVVVWNSRDAMDRSLEALRDPSRAMATSDISGIFDQTDSNAVVRAGLISRNPEAGSARLRMARATWDLTLTDDTARSALRVIPEEEALAPKWEDLLRGGVALMALQTERPVLAELARHTNVSTTDAKTVVAEMSVGFDLLWGMIPYRD